MEIPDIVNFEEVIRDVIPSGKKFVRCEKAFLTAPGENYASLMLGLTTVIQDKGNGDSKEEMIHSVAKLLAPCEFMRQFMNIPYTVRNELAFYQTIVPTLRNFQKEQGSSKSLQFLPDFHGGRLGLDKSKNTLDEHAILILENLKVPGYVLMDNELGLDLETTKLILSKMAELHGAFIALRETKKDVFEKKLLPYFDEFEIFQMAKNDGFMTCDVVVNAITDIIREDKQCSPYMDRIQKIIKSCVTNLHLPKNSAKFRQHVFASLIHDDLWVNNIMVKTHLNKVVDVKLVDWQLYEYGSVVEDILFFVCSSAQHDVLKDRFDDLFKFYHENLIDNLIELKCDVEKFSFDEFQKEMKTVASETAFFYMMMALPSIFPTGDNVLEVHEINREGMLRQVTQASDIGKRRIGLITYKFIEKGWI
ncbi:hypothetical protein Zmor_010108 [Zophobas morio]|uniref:CHK kinase-like domain-containing protein n=1 Tax=Zophobas morio TaxID=2755281 RepID=A0AA38IK07_9CUCU|nr:hypothetical protein Zmor_010108 [Zophobas morio]